MLPLLLVCGPRGVGKSSVGFQIFLDIMVSGVKVGYIDLDQVSFCRPIPRDDPPNDRVRMRNLARLASVYQEAGARCLITSGDVSDADMASAYRAAVPDLKMSICHLDATSGVLRERVLARGRGEGPPIAGDELRGMDVDSLDRLADEAAREAQDPKRASLGDVHVPTDGRTVAEVAASVRAALGDWPGGTAI